MKKIAVILLVLLTVINVAALGFFLHHRFADLRTQRPAPHRRLARELKLEEEQVRQMRNVRKDFRRRSQPIRASLCHNHRALIEHLQAASVDTSTIDSLLGQISTLQASMHREAIYAMHREGEKLDPDQRARFYGILKQRICNGGAFSMMHKSHRHHRRPHDCRKGGTREAPDFQER